MKMIPFLALFLSISAFAQENQCSTPGQVLAREFLKLSGEETKKPFYREGHVNISMGGFLRGDITARTFKDYRETFCFAKTYSTVETVCTPVSLGDALGRGNETLRSLFDLNLSLLSRAEIFAKAVAFFPEATSAERLSFSRQIVVSLGRQASAVGIPQNWESFSNMLTAVVTAGEIPQSVLDQIVTVNVEKNKKSLGFKPMEGVTMTEGKGNGKLQKFFNLQLSVKVRSDLIRTTLVGVGERSAEKLSVSFIEFATSNGIPTSWDQFLLLMKASQASGAISEAELLMIIAENETENRVALGFEQSAKICKEVTQTRTVNILEKRDVKDFLANVVKKFEIQLSQAPLLIGEREDYNVMFDGLSKIALNYTNQFNAYTTTSYTDANGVVKMSVTGARKQVTPRNNIGAGIKRNGKLINVVLQNKDFSPQVQGRVLVKVVFFEEIPLWPDYKLGTKIFELASGDVSEFATQLALRNVGRKVRLDVSVQVLGSAYFNDQSSAVVEVKGL